MSEMWIPVSGNAGTIQYVSVGIDLHGPAGEIADFNRGEHMRTDALLELICLLPIYPFNATIKSLMADYQRCVGASLSGNEMIQRIRRIQKRHGVKIVQWKDDGRNVCVAIDPASWAEAQRIGMEYAAMTESQEVPMV
jgi:hypothetical protein